MSGSACDLLAVTFAGTFYCCPLPTASVKPAWYSQQPLFGLTRVQVLGFRLEFFPQSTMESRNIALLGALLFICRPAAAFVSVVGPVTANNGPAATLGSPRSASAPWNEHARAPVSSRAGRRSRAGKALSMGAKSVSARAKRARPAGVVKSSSFGCGGDVAVLALSLLFPFPLCGVCSSKVKHVCGSLRSCVYMYLLRMPVVQLDKLSTKFYQHVRLGPSCRSRLCFAFVSGWLWVIFAG